MMALALVGVLAFVACEDDDEDSNRFEANLTAGAERPLLAGHNAVTATGTFSVTDNGASMTHTLTVNGLPANATAAHIHVAPTRPGTNLPAAADTFGGVVVNLNPATNCQTCTLAQGSFTTGQGVSLDSVRALLTTGRAYVNVHSAAFPAGIIRGNITRD